MITNQYLLYREMMFYGTYKTFKYISGETATGYAQYSYAGDIGNKMHFAWSKEPDAMYTSSYATGAGLGCVCFGTGSTPPTKDDYCLESTIASGLSVTSGNQIFREYTGDGKYIFQASYTVKNISEEEIVIREIGLHGEVGAGAGSNKYNYYMVLFERTVLDEPIAIAPGASKIVTYTLTFNQTA